MRKCYASAVTAVVIIPLFLSSLLNSGIKFIFLRTALQTVHKHALFTVNIMTVIIIAVTDIAWMILFLCRVATV